MSLRDSLALFSLIRYQSDSTSTLYSYEFELGYTAEWYQWQTWIELQLGARVSLVHSGMNSTAHAILENELQYIRIRSASRGWDWEVLFLLADAYIYIYIIMINYNYNKYSYYFWSRARAGIARFTDPCGQLRMQQLQSFGKLNVNYIYINYIIIIYNVDLCASAANRALIWYTNIKDNTHVHAQYIYIYIQN
jgi:hypothetical protein